MKQFTQLETGVWTYVDKRGKVHVYTPQELETYLQSNIWWRKIKIMLGL